MQEDKKFKVLILSDHALSTSGVGTQTRHLVEGLIKKGCWTFRQFGAALKHADYRTIVVNEDFIIKPIDGFGNPELLRVTLATEKPDVVFLFTDPRFFIWLFEMEDEIHQICPIVWWHVWDNYPYPEFNEVLYEATDLINCHSHMTYTMLKDRHKKKTNFIPHALPENLFFPITEQDKLHYKTKIVGHECLDHFIGIWVNRNAKRKRPSDVLIAWQKFLDKTKDRKATLIMHTDPFDNEGPNLVSVCENLGIQENVYFSNERLDFEKMNVLYNISDFCINMSYAEGFGLSRLEAMMTGTPIIAAKTGGLTRQVIDHKDSSENGVGLDIKVKSLVGSQSVPYIYEDYCDQEDAANAMMKLYKLNKEEKKELSDKVLKYAREEFSMEKTIDQWHNTLLDTIENWKSRRVNWETKEF